MHFRELRNIAILTTVALSPLLVAAAQTPSGTPGAADKMFLHKAAKGGYAEVQLGQLAAQKGNSDDVKKFGQKMVDDHTALNDQMKPFVEQAGLQPPTKLDKKDQAEFDKLSGLSGDAFDKEYIAYMVKDHHADLHEFRHEEATTQDASLKDAVVHGESVIKEHNDMVDNLAKQMGLPVASHHRAPAAPAAE
jgi:putative membrane protein